MNKMTKVLPCTNSKKFTLSSINAESIDVYSSFPGDSTIERVLNDHPSEFMDAEAPLDDQL